MDVLIIWDDYPSEISRFIKLKDIKEEVELLKTFHNHYINSESIDPNIENKMLWYFYDTAYQFKYEKIDKLIENEYFGLIILTGIFS